MSPDNTLTKLKGMMSVASLQLSYSNWMIFDSCRKFEHKKYSGGWANSNTYTVDYDFALLKLTNGFDIPNIPNVSPACLPSMNKAPANVEARTGY